MRRFAVASLLLLLVFGLFSVLSVGCGGVSDSRVRIGADGTVYGSVGGGAENIQRVGDVYTFVGDLSFPLYVERDNVVVDGAGYTLVGGSGRGVVLADRYNVTVRNVRVELDGGYTIDVEDAVDCALVGNTLVGTQSLGPIGVNFLHSQGITVKDNTVVDCWRGLSLEWSTGHTVTGNTFIGGVNGIEVWSTTGCVFRNNSMIDCSFSIRVYSTYEYGNDLDSSNTIDGKPIYYLVGAEGVTVPSDAAYIVLVDCKNMLVEDASPHGIALLSTDNSTVRRVRLTERGDGIDLLHCSGISILDSVLRNNAIGIQLEGSSGNTIRGNEISNHTTRGLSLGGSNNVISGNVFSDNSYAIAHFQDVVSAGNVVSSNNFTGNHFALIMQGSMQVVNNRFENNAQAVMLSSGSGGNIIQNTFKDNEYALYISGSSGNNIYLNNFLVNGHQVTDAGVSSSEATAQPADASSSGSLQLAAARFETVNWIPPPPPSTNNWDNGAKGNYWSDYTGVDADGDGVGDTAYFLYENNQDNRPLMAPVAASEVPPETPSATDEPPASTPSPDTSSPENTAPPDNALGDTPHNPPVPEGTAGADLPIEYVVAAVAVVVAVIAVVGCVFLKRRNPQSTP